MPPELNLTVAQRRVLLLAFLRRLGEREARMRAFIAAYDDFCKGSDMGQLLLLGDDAGNPFDQMHEMREGLFND